LTFADYERLTLSQPSIIRRSRIRPHLPANGDAEVSKDRLRLRPHALEVGEEPVSVEPHELERPPLPLLTNGPTIRTTTHTALRIAIGPPRISRKG
jgi:hypothetical protein